MLGMVKKTELREFLHAVDSCSDEVWYCNESGDRLALKSELNKIMFLAMVTGAGEKTPEEYFIECSDADRMKLAGFTELR